MKELSSRYNPKETEGRIYKLWEKSGAFTPQIKEGVKPFVIVIPPPNVTGSLHMGHALNNTIQDILIRRSRMKAVPTLWIPGTDHAGIATQNVVEKQLAKENKNRHDLGRKDFEKRVWQWVDEYGNIIIDQLKKMGCSCDWSRQRFTMDEDYSEAVKAAFKHYYDKGWIYQGERVINWCVRCQTALSDIELEHKEVEGKLWFIRYPISHPELREGSPVNAGLANKLPDSSPSAQNDEFIVVATTRPETMLGDTAVAVNPKDERYKDLVGKTAILPLLNREIPIIADEAIDPKFGTGALKVTPAHDINDFEIGERHQLEKIKVIDETGKITLRKCDYFGQKVLVARENILNDLKAENLIEKEEDYLHEVPHCYRCGRQVEQLISKQWFVKMSELIKPAIEAVKKDEIKITPTRWKKVYLDWMENIRDWCISRQIWWGHRLPVFVKKQENLKSQNSNLKINEDYYIGDNPPEGFRQVDDVLDTWFSSALWPFATLGWPKCHPECSEGSATNVASQTKLRDSSPVAQNDKSCDLDYFYPTTILSTARDINMLWVVRMIFSGYEFMGQKPFDKVYVHPTVFNVEGKRMSKSLGTGVDPLELINKYGADAVRFGLTYINTGTQDIKFDENAILAGKKFANKVWNISRFVLKQTGNSKQVIASTFDSLSVNSAKQSQDRHDAKASRDDIPNPKSQIDKTILEKTAAIIKSTEENLDEFRFGQAGHDLYDFVWHDLADQYLEAAKIQMENLEYRLRTTEILLYVLVTSLKLLHPTMPFITEEIWQELARQKLVDKPILMTAKWPSQNDQLT